MHGVAQNESVAVTPGAAAATTPRNDFRAVGRNERSEIPAMEPVSWTIIEPQRLKDTKNKQSGIPEVGCGACTHLHVPIESLRPKRWVNLSVVNSVSKENQ